MVRSAQEASPMKYVVRSLLLFLFALTVAPTAHAESIRLLGTGVIDRVYNFG